MISNGLFKEENEAYGIICEEFGLMFEIILF